MTSTAQGTGSQPAHQSIDDPDAPPRGGWISELDTYPLPGRHRAGRKGLVSVGVLVGLHPGLPARRRTRRTGGTA